MVYQFYLFSQRTSFWLCWFLLWSLLFLLHLFLPTGTKTEILINGIIFKISFLLLALRFFISSFSSCFRCRVRLFIWLFSFFLRYACIAMNLPLSTAFPVSHRFWVVVFSFSFVYAYFDFFCDLLVIQYRVVQPPYAGISNSFSPVTEI